MLRFQNLRWLIVIVASFIIMTVPATAQSATGLDVEIDETGVSVFRINADGSQSLIIFVPALLETVVEAPPENTFSTSADVLLHGFLIINTSSLNVRSGPGTEYTVIATVAGGEEVGVVGRNDGREFWWYVELDNGTRGWINNIHTLIRGDLSDAPIIMSSGTLVQPTLYIGYAGNPIFPSVPHKGIAVCTLPGQVEFPIVGRTSQSSWYQIVATCEDGRSVTGWIQAELGIVRNPAGIEFPVTN